MGMVLDQATVNRSFQYKDGFLYWKKTGIIAGTKHHDGYIQIGFQKKLYGAHRLIFLLSHGWMPKVIDHIDGCRSNNKIQNLRQASWSENLQNMKLRSTNKSSCKNVSWSKTKKKWCVQLSIKGTQTNLGRYDDIELADLVATEARNKYHGAFARHK